VLYGPEPAAASEVESRHAVVRRDAVQGEAVRFLRRGLVPSHVSLVETLHPIIIIDTSILLGGPQSKTELTGAFARRTGGAYGGPSTSSPAWPSRRPTSRPPWAFTSSH
jgi:hypothetical protein